MYKPEGMSGFKKQMTAKVNPLLAQLDISKLESGNYYLVVELRDAASKLQLEKKWFFQRESSFKNAITNSTSRSVYEFFGNYNNTDTLKMFVECLWPISTTVEREWQINVSVQKNPELMKKYIVDYWQKKAGDSLDPLQLWLSYYTKVLEVNKIFKCGKQKGYYTDRGRVYLQYGKPDQRAQRPSEPDAYPYEIWQYYRIEDKSNGQFYSNKKFVFANKMIADDCFQLIHSDVRGELNNPKWQYEIQKSDNRDRNNFDKTKPNSSYGNNADDLFSNPR
jgi:GWxTD domain-containing protein